MTLKPITKKEELEYVQKKTGRFQGRVEYIAFLKGQHVSASQRLRANCFRCMGYYHDGTQDCGDTLCPLHPKMPYYGAQNSRRDPEDIKRSRNKSRRKRVAVVEAS